MPLPKSITHFNKHITNRLITPFAGWIPPLAVIEHNGRKSGRQYRTPILAFPTTSGYAFALTYGRNVDWAKNLQAATYGVLHYNGNSIRVHDFHYTSYEDTKKIFPDIVRLFLDILHVKECILAERLE